MDRQSLKYKFLGTAAAEGWPGVFCNCDSCSNALSLGGKNLRLRTSALINDDLLCDLSPDLVTFRTRYALNMQKISTVIITHTHLDHFCPQILSYNTKNFSVSPVSLNIICSEYTKKLLIDTPYENKAALENISITAIKEFETIKTSSGYAITALPAAHSAPQSYIYVVKREGITLLYCNDTYLLPQKTLDYLKNITLDMVSFDATMGLRTQGHARHLSFYDIIDTVKYFTEQGISHKKTIYAATHFSHFIGLTHKEIEDFFRPHNIITAYDGLELFINAPSK